MAGLRPWLVKKALSIGKAASSRRTPQKTSGSSFEKGNRCVKS
jgi:hypothetical protein